MKRKRIGLSMRKDGGGEGRAEPRGERRPAAGSNRNADRKPQGGTGKSETGSFGSALAEALKRK